MEGIVYVAVSNDGFIADEAGGVGWLAPFDSHDYGYEQFFAGMDLLIMGRTTYEQVLGFGNWPYEDKPCYVLTSRPIADAPPGVQAWGRGTSALSQELWRRGGRAWIVGGSKTIDAMFKAGLVGKVETTIIPVTLERGIPLWLDPPNLDRWGHFDLKRWENGVVHRRLIPPPC